MSQVIVKVRRPRAAAARSDTGPAVPAALQSVAKEFPGVQMQSLFPGDADPDMAALYVLDPAKHDVGALLGHLRKQRGVEYAHVSAERRPVAKARPTGRARGRRS